MSYEYCEESDCGACGVCGSDLRPGHVVAYEDAAAARLGIGVGVCDEECAGEVHPNGR